MAVMLDDSDVVYYSWDSLVAILYSGILRYGLVYFCYYSIFAYTDYSHYVLCYRRLCYWLLLCDRFDRGGDLGVGEDAIWWGIGFPRWGSSPFSFLSVIFFYGCILCMWTLILWMCGCWDGLAMLDKYIFWNCAFDLWFYRCVLWTWVFKYYKGFAKTFSEKLSVVWTLFLNLVDLFFQIFWCAGCAPFYENKIVAPLKLLLCHL